MSRQSLGLTPLFASLAAEEVRALDSREIFMSPLSYAAAPFQANIEQRRLPVTLRALAKTTPGEPLRIGYKTDRPARIAKLGLVLFGFAPSGSKAGLRDLGLGSRGTAREEQRQNGQTEDRAHGHPFSKLAAMTMRWISLVPS